MNFAPYVPIVRVLPGDMEGIRHVSFRAQRLTRPLFVIVEPRPRKSDTGASFLVNAANLIVNSWRLKGIPSVELFDLPTAGDKDWFSMDHPLILLHRYLRQRGIASIPVTHVYREGEYLDAFIDSVKAEKNGLGIRLYADELEEPNRTIQRVSVIARACDCENPSVDLIVDLQRIRPDQLALRQSQLDNFLSTVDRLTPFRSITLAGSSLPENLSGIPVDDERDVPRLDLLLWRAVRVARGPDSLLGHGDHVAVRPEYEDRKSGFENINAKLIYTLEEVTRIIRGHSRKLEKLEFQYPGLARRLVDSGVVPQTGFSWGDDRIVACAANRWVSGQPMTWVSVATSHHIELASTQVARELGMIT